MIPSGVRTSLKQTMTPTGANLMMRLRGGGAEVRGRAGAAAHCVSDVAVGRERGRGRGRETGAGRGRGKELSLKKETGAGRGRGPAVDLGSVSEGAAGAGLCVFVCVLVCCAIL